MSSYKAARRKLLPSRRANHKGISPVTNQTLAQHTKPEVLLAASMLVRLAHPDNASLHRALDKASIRLSTHPWRLFDRHLEITSESHPNQIQTTDGEYCTCKTTRGVCWHQAAWHVLAAVAGAGGIISPALPLPDMAAVDEAYNDWEPEGDFLDISPLPVREVVPAAGSRLAAAQAAADMLF